MLSSIVLVGEKENELQLLKGALPRNQYSVTFVPFVAAGAAVEDLSAAALVIVNTLPLSESDLPRLSTIIQKRREGRFPPILALVAEKPSRLRHRLVQMGIDDYLLAPCEKLDIRVRVGKMLDQQSGPREARMTAGGNADSAALARLAQLSNTKNPDGGTDFQSWQENLFRHIKEYTGTQHLLLFELLHDNTLVLRSGETAAGSGLEFPLAEISAMQRAVNFQEPTVLNSVSSANKLAAFLGKQLGCVIRSFMVYPVATGGNARQLLCLLKSDSGKFSEAHFQFVHTAAHLMALRHEAAYKRSPADLENHKTDQGEQEPRLDPILDQLHFGLLMIDSARRIRFINQPAARLLNLLPQAVTNRRLTDVFSGEVVEDILNSVGISPFSIDRPEIELPASDGKKVLVGFSVYPFRDPITAEDGHIITMKDITYTREVQEEMQRVDRLASLGIMASGIAHEIRNPLAAIKAIAQTFQEEIPPGDARAEYMPRIIGLVNRLDDLLRTLFSYASPPKPNRVPCQVTAILEEVLGLLKQKLREHEVKVISRLPADMPSAFVDPAQLQQILVNLLLNSVESIEGRGEIKIHLQPFEYHSGSTAPAPRPRLSRSGLYLEIIIQDNGCGIDAANLGRIFNPFFTTKPLGTGLGLSIVYQIVKQNAGAIYFKSQPGQGTECYLYLPTQPPGVNGRDES